MVHRFPIFIPSKGRHESRITMRTLRNMGVPYTVIVEESERDAYAAKIDGGRIVVLDPAYQRDYDACMDLAPGESRGSGPARNMAWDIAQAEGHEWHWVVDDNIRNFYRVWEHRKIRVGDGSFFRVMEDFAMRYRNVAMAGPNYEAFVPKTRRNAPFYLNTRIYSCNLIRTGLNFRWRGRYNEDTDLSLRMLKSGYCTILFNTFVADKIRTMVVKGGNTDSIYADGTVRKSLMLVRLHPDVARITWRFGREHHYVDYRRFKKLRLLRDESVEIPAENPYRLELAPRDPTLGRRP